MTEPGVPLRDLVEYLDDFLRIREVADEPNAVNGLQVENTGTIDRIVAAVDASLEAIEGAGERDSGSAGQENGTLLLVHHGLFWEGNVPLTGRRFRRVRALIDRNIALYSAHIPLDLHPDVGNNIVLARRLGIELEGWFGDYRGAPVGVHGRLALPRHDLVSQIDSLLGTEARLLPGGPAATSRVGIITGGAGGFIGQARDAGLDTFITGEGAHHTYFDAMEFGLNVIYAGHYATEQVGVQALAQHLGLHFQVPWEFHRHPTGL
jgi:dinuclear metal center YbgI/SA1388 family protein